MGGRATPLALIIKPLRFVTRASAPHSARNALRRIARAFVFPFPRGEKIKIPISEISSRARPGPGDREGPRGARLRGRARSFQTKRRAERARSDRASLDPVGLPSRRSVNVSSHPADAEGRRRGDVGAAASDKDARRDNARVEIGRLESKSSEHAAGDAGGPGSG